MWWCLDRKIFAPPDAISYERHDIYRPCLDYNGVRSILEWEKENPNEPVPLPPDMLKILKEKPVTDQNQNQNIGAQLNLLL